MLRGMFFDDARIWLVVQRDSFLIVLVQARAFIIWQSFIIEIEIENILDTLSLFWKCALFKYSSIKIIFFVFCFSKFIVVYFLFPILSQKLILLFYFANFVKLQRI